MVPKSGNRISDKPPAQTGRQRIDKWLWHARMVRTRSDAAALADAGYVRINGKRIAGNSQVVRAGDVVTLALDRSVRVLRVEGFCERRGTAAAARALYRDVSSESGPAARKNDAD
jgi:ribosome-associated heat shock protein Hsp15